MYEKAVEVLIQTGAAGVIAALIIWQIGGRLDKLTAAVSTLHEKIAVMLDREGTRLR